MRQALLVGRGVALLAAFLLAMRGFADAYEGLRGHPGSLADNLLRAIRLVTGQFPPELDDRPLPWTLTAARWGVPLLALWNAAGVVWLKLRNPVMLRWIRRRGEHLVLAGGAPLAPSLAAGGADAGRRTILWTEDPALPWIAGAADLGVPHAPSGGEDHGAAAVGLERARAALLIHDDDALNLSLATAALDHAAAARPPGDPLPVFARVDDLDLRLAAEQRFGDRGHATARLRLLSLPDLAGRRLFKDRPLDSFVRVGAPDRLVLALGFTPLIESYLLRLLAGGHFRDGRPRVVVLAPDAAAHERVFRARRPGADLLAPVTFEAAAIDQPALLRGLLDEATGRHGLPVLLLIDPADEARALALAYAADGWFRERRLTAPPIHARIGACPERQLGSAIFRLGGVDLLGDPEELLQEGHDELARSIHDVYLEGRLGAGQQIGAHAALCEWDDLPESVRDDNRLVADCYRLKLRDIGARLKEGDGPAFRFDPEELEELSRAEHDRWMAAKLIGGWRHGGTRDDARKFHPDIVGYDALSEPIKELDREQIRLMTRLLPRAGLVPQRVLTVLVEGGGGSNLAEALALVARRYPDRFLMPLARFDDVEACTALLGLVGYPLQLAVAGNADEAIDRRAGANGDALRPLVRHADTIWSFPPDTPPGDVDAWLRARSGERVAVGGS